MYNKSLKKIPIDYRRGTHRSTARNTCKAIVSGRRPFWTDKRQETLLGTSAEQTSGRATGGKGVFVRYGGSESIRRHISSLVMPWVDAEVMSIFLAHTSEMFKKEFCLMFLDGAGWHRANNLRVPHNMKLLWLPPYSPELNPVEHIWEYVRENSFGNKSFDSLDDVEDLLCSSLVTLEQQPNIVRSLTSFDWFNTLPLSSN